VQNKLRNVSRGYRQESRSGSDHRSLLVFVTARGRHVFDSSRRTRDVLAWVKDQARVADVEEDYSKDNHTILMSALCHFGDIRRIGQAYTLSKPMKAPWSWNADPLYPELNS
jgi:hypothetical protein